MGKRPAIRMPESLTPQRVTSTPMSVAVCGGPVADPVHVIQILVSISVISLMENPGAKAVAAGHHDQVGANVGFWGSMHGSGGLNWPPPTTIVNDVGHYVSKIALWARLWRAWTPSPDSFGARGMALICCCSRAPAPMGARGIHVSAAFLAWFWAGCTSFRNCMRWCHHSSLPAEHNKWSTAMDRTLTVPCTYGPALPLHSISSCNGECQTFYTLEQAEEACSADRKAGVSAQSRGPLTHLAAMSPSHHAWASSSPHHWSVSQSDILAD